MYSLSSSGALRRVPTHLVLVAGVHLAVIWALINGLHVQVLPAPPPSTEASVIDTQAPPPDTFVVKESPRFNVVTPIPDPKVDPINEPLPTAISQQRSNDPLPPSTGAVAALPTPVVTGAAVDPRHPLTQPAYPTTSIRNTEEGALSLSVLVGTDGRVHDAKVAASSGFARLDEAAVNEAKARWHLRPATRDGVPFEQWLTLRVVFRLENR